MLGFFRVRQNNKIFVGINRVFGIYLIAKILDFEYNDM